MKISHILKGKDGHVFTIRQDGSMQDALREMLAHNIGSLVVVGAGEAMIGIVSERDMLRTVYNSGSGWETVQVSTAMTAEVITAKPGDSADYAMDLMTKHRIRHLPVLDGGKLAGMLSIGDIVKANLTETAFQNQLLKNFIRNWPEQGVAAEG
jgi:CBS domain-containing protein